MSAPRARRSPLSTRVVVFIDKDGNSATLEREFKQFGGTIERSIPGVGIFGTLPGNMLDRVRDRPGVKYVREEGGFQLPPSSGDVPQ